MMAIKEELASRDESVSGNKDRLRRCSMRPSCGIIWRRMQRMWTISCEAVNKAASDV